ncbi:hypothetical protein AY599_07555 [Leptolyngbya valderiana BDU 20041]|nr:hypothetical protein AY599_07555 [Leptolyngbya valderiana BDU 20041]PPT07084.1 hypothetical protein CKA32_004845 [Geitlerinema sp. FC II]
MADTAIDLPDGDRLSVTIGIGSTIAQEDSSISASKFIDRGDLTLYRTKASDRNCVRLTRSVSSTRDLWSR